MSEIRLTPEEYAAAAELGSQRYRESIAHRMRDTRGQDSERSHRVGAVGEAVVAKALGVVWSRSINTFKHELDVAGYEVRTRTTVNGELIIRANDPDDRTYVLVVPTCDALRFEVVGQARAGLIKATQRFYRTDRGDPPAWFVPQWALLPFYMGVLQRASNA